MFSRDLAPGCYKRQKALVLCVVRHDGSNFSVESMVRTAATLAARFCHVGVCMLQEVWCDACTVALMLHNSALKTKCFAAWGYPVSFEQSKEDALWEAVDSHGQHFVRRYCYHFEKQASVFIDVL